jgi:hypothetical protein
MQARAWHPLSRLSYALAALKGPLQTPDWLANAHATHNQGQRATGAINQGQGLKPCTLLCIAGPLALCSSRAR